MFTPLMIPGGDPSHVVFADEACGSRRALNFAPSVDFGSRSPAELSGCESKFVEWLFARSGLSASDFREETLARRVPACLRALRVQTLDEARAVIELDAHLLNVAIDAMIIGVTSFFRDRPVFDALDKHIGSFESGRMGLQIWSAGCSDGQELYSLAILLHRHGLLEGARLLGTDCRPRAIGAAQIGIYRLDDVRSLPRELRVRYFTAAENAFRIQPMLRTRVRWKIADVLRTCESGPWDVILCRNLCMYLRGGSLGQLMKCFYNAMRPGGVMVLGKAERPVGVPLTCVAPCIFQRT